MDALRVLESGQKTKTALKASMLRLLANLAEYIESARIVIQPNLIDRIAIMISNNETMITDSALRTVRLLSKHRIYTRVSRLMQFIYLITLARQQPYREFRDRDRNREKVK